MKRPINLCFLLASITSFVLLGVAIYFLHTFQLHRQAVFMLERARHARDEKRLEAAIHDYQTYLRVAPKDADAHAELGLLLADMGMAWPASRSLETALRLVPEREDLRKRLVQLDLALRRYGDAREHLQLLLAASSTDDVLWEQFGIAQAGGGDDRAAVDSFQKAIELFPARYGSYIRLAVALRRLGRAQDADNWTAKLVAANPQSPQAHSLRAHYLHAYTADRGEAVAEADRAAALAPDDFDVLLLAASLHTAADEYEKARGYADRAIAAKPERAGGYHAAFQIESLLGGWKTAMTGLRRGIEKASDPGVLLWDECLVLVAQGQVTEAQQTVETLRRLPRQQSFDPVLVDFAQGEIETALGHWTVAAKAFVDVVRQLESFDPRLGNATAQDSLAHELLKDALCRLGICYERMGEPDAQLAAYRKAAQIDPLWVPARMGVAATLASQGQITEALEEYKHIKQLKGATAAADIRIARLLVLKNLRVPESERDWKEVESTLNRLSTTKAEVAEVTLLRGEVMLAQGRGEEAEKLLAAARDQHPDSVDFWAALLRLADQKLPPQRADELLNQAESKFGDCVWIRLARAQHRLARQGATTIADVVKLGQGASKFSASDRLRLHRGLAECLLTAGDLKLAKAEAFKAYQADNSDSAARLLLLELTCQTQDTAAAEKVLHEIRMLEGETALWHYGEALHLAILTEHPQGAQEGRQPFDQAFEHLASAEKLRPLWGRIPLLRARLQDQLGQTDQAIDNYIKAVNAGEVNSLAASRGFALLYSRQRYAEADAMLRTLGQHNGVLVPELGRIASEVSVRSANLDRAVAIARQVAEKSNDWSDHLWLGQVVAFQGQRSDIDHRAKEAQDFYVEAEKSFRKAVKLSPATPEAWVGLVRFLVQSGRKEQAEAALAEAVQGIPADKTPRALGPCYEMLGHMDKAAAQYRRILANSGNDPLALRQVAEFCLRTNKPLEAETHLKMILSPEIAANSRDIAWARRALAGILRSRGGYANLLKAVDLVDQDLADASSAEVLVEKALLLASFPQRAKRQEAIAGLEKAIEVQRTDTTNARFTLAHLYLRQKDWPQARKQMLAILASHGSNPRYIAAYVGMLFDHDEMREAGVWLERLEALTPGNPANLVFRVEMLVRRQQIDGAIQLLREKLSAGSVGASPAPPGGPRIDDQNVLEVVLCLKVSAARASQRGDRAAKERLLAEMDNVVTNSTTRSARLGFLKASVRLLQGKADEALSLAEKSWPNTEPSLLAEEASEWVESTNITQEQAARLDQLLLSAAERQGRPQAILQALGDLRMRFRTKDAVGVYREILKRDAENLTALNNLALLLALQRNDVQESLRLINRAIAIAGPAGAYLDTRAVALMAGGRPDEALNDLNESILDDPRPKYHFHQALALWHLGRTQAADDAIREAASRGLKPQDLVGLERANYEELLQKLAQHKVQ